VNPYIKTQIVEGTSNAQSAYQNPFFFTAGHGSHKPMGNVYSSMVRPPLVADQFLSDDDSDILSETMTKSQFTTANYASAMS